MTNPKNNSSSDLQYDGLKQLKTLTAIFIKEVFKRINNFSQQQNFLINGNLNLLLWEVSKYVNEEPLSKHHDVQKKIEIYEPILSSRNFDKLFTRKELHEITKFARKVPDLAVASWMAHALSWKHIRILLSIENLEAIIYYTALALKKNMNAQDLKKAIQRNDFNARAYKKVVDRELISAFQNPLLRTTVKKTNHIIQTITSIDYEFKNIYSISSAIDICKNPWFIRLIKQGKRIEIF